MMGIGRRDAPYVLNSPVQIQQFVDGSMRYRWRRSDAEYSFGTPDVDARRCDLGSVACRRVPHVAHHDAGTPCLHFSAIRPP
jgi:hypothetical protein